jgi:hypothetical protein
VDFTGQSQFVGKTPDIGPYEYGAKQYWIPGFKFTHSSTPVPINGSDTVQPDADLMWLGGYNSSKHHVYWGNTAQEVEAATLTSPLYRGLFKGDDNLYSFDKKLTSGQQVFWRVDAQGEGKIVKGEVWSFKVK